MRTALLLLVVLLLPVERVLRAAEVATRSGETRAMSSTSSGESLSTDGDRVEWLDGKKRTVRRDFRGEIVAVEFDVPLYHVHSDDTQPLTAADFRQIVAMAPRVKEISLQHIPVSPGSLEPLADLTDLRVFRARFCTPLPVAELAHLPKGIDTLRIVSRSRVPGRLPIGHLTQLKCLTLGDLDMDDSSLDGLPEFRLLEEFGCSDCTGVSDRTAELLRTIPSLQTVHLAAVEITDDAVKSLAGLPGLKNLLLPSKISAVGVGNLANHPSLETLTLQLPTDACIEPLASIPRLENLILLGASLSDAGLAKIASMRGLKALELTAAEGITRAGVARFAQDSRVERLVLYGTSLDDEGLASLAGLTNLRQLVVIEREVSTEAVAKFRRSRPNVELFGVDDLRGELDKRGPLVE